MLNEIDSAADIRIYNYKTKTVHTEKCLVIYKKDSEKIVCFGNECEEYYEK